MARKIDFAKPKKAKKKKGKKKKPNIDFPFGANVGKGKRRGGKGGGS